MSLENGPGGHIAPASRRVGPQSDGAEVGHTVPCSALKILDATHPVNPFGVGAPRLDGPRVAEKGSYDIGQQTGAAWRCLAVFGENFLQKHQKVFAFSIAEVGEQSLLVQVDLTLKFAQQGGALGGQVRRV